MKQPRWEWGSSEMPIDLPQIIDNLENEILDQYYELSSGLEKDRVFPKVEDQFYSLHKSGIIAIERVKSELLSSK